SPALSKLVPRGERERYTPNSDGSVRMRPPTDRSVDRVASIKLRPSTTVAAAAASENEFQTAARPAASAPGNSVQVRLSETSSNRGTPRDRKQRAMAQAPELQ